MKWRTDENGRREANNVEAKIAAFKDTGEEFLKKNSEKKEEKCLKYKGNEKEKSGKEERNTKEIPFCITQQITKVTERRLVENNNIEKIKEYNNKQ
jgi:hypothetical protein